jgi:hypothetical protein
MRRAIDLAAGVPEPPRADAADPADGADRASAEGEPVA